MEERLEHALVKVMNGLLGFLMFRENDCLLIKPLDMI